MSDSDLAQRVKDLRDQGLGWKEVAVQAGVSEKGSPKKAKRLYEQATGQPVSTAPRQASPSQSSAQSATQSSGPASRPRPRKRRARGAQSDLASHNTAPLFSDETEEDEIVRAIQKKRVAVQRMVPPSNDIRVDEHHVHEVTDFGISEKSGVRWVRFWDGERKSRTVPVNAIVRIS